MDITPADVVWVRHAGIRSRDDLGWAFQQILEILAFMTEYHCVPWMDVGKAENATSVLVVARVLTNLRAKVEQLFRDGQHRAAQNYLCVPRCIVRGMDEELLVMQKYVSSARFYWTVVTSPVELPLTLVFLGLFASPADAVDAAQIRLRYLQLENTSSYEVIREAADYAVERQESMLQTSARVAATVAGFLKAAANAGAWPV